MRELGQPWVLTAMARRALPLLSDTRGPGCDQKCPFGRGTATRPDEKRPNGDYAAQAGPSRLHHGVALPLNTRSWFAIQIDLAAAYNPAC
jgi:hypothetical protein